MANVDIESFSEELEKEKDPKKIALKVLKKTTEVKETLLKEWHKTTRKMDVLKNLLDTLKVRFFKIIAMAWTWRIANYNFIPFVSWVSLIYIILFIHDDD